MSQSGRFGSGTGAPPIETLTGNAGGAVGPDGAGNIDFVGDGTVITVTGTPASNLLTITAAQSTTTNLGVVELATDAETIAGTDTDRAVVPSSLSAKLGTQTQYAMAYGNTTSGAIQWTAAGTNGQIPIAATGAAPVFANIISTGGTIVITNGVNSIDLDTGGTIADEFDGDSGTAQPSGGVLTIAGGTNITTVAAADTVTINLDDAITLATSVTSPIYQTNAGADLVLNMADDAGTYSVSFTNNSDAEVAFVDSLGGATFNGPSTGSVGAYDLRVGDTDGSPTYGLIQIGASVWGRTSINIGSLDIDGSTLIWNNVTPATSPIQFAFAESGNAVRFAIPISGVGNATYNPRSMLLAGPAPLNSAMVTVGYWQGLGIFDNLACDTSGSGADLGVQNDLEVEGDIFTDSIRESTTAAGITLTVSGAGRVSISYGTQYVLPVFGASGSVENLTDGVGAAGQVLTSNGAGAEPTWEDAATGFTWNEETGTSANMVVNNGYITNNAGLVTVTLPSTAAVGDVVRVTGKGAGGWRIAQNASQTIYFGTMATTTGVGGRLDSTQQRDSIELLCVTANNDWNVLSSIGNITVT